MLTFAPQTWVSQLERELDERGDVEDQLKQKISKLEKQLSEKDEEKERDETEDVEEEAVVREVGQRSERSPGLQSDETGDRRPGREGSQMSLEEEMIEEAGGKSHEVSQALDSRCIFPHM